VSVANVSLTLLGCTREVEASELSPGVSPFTGKPLRALAVTLVAQSEDENERLVTELDEAADGTGAIQAEGGQWRVTSQEYDARAWAGGVRYLHRVELRELDDFAPARVEFGAFALAPDRWELDEADPATFRFLTTLEAGDHQHLQQFHGQMDSGGSYFPVTWGGTSHEPVPMRFGQCLWEAADDGGARHLITLVAQEEGDAQGSGAGDLFGALLDPWKPRLVENAMRMRSGFDALLGELEQGGVLDGEAIGRIKDRIANPDVSGAREFDRVYGIEDYFK
jgi:hypothetical protein